MDGSQVTGACHDGLTSATITRSARIVASFSCIPPRFSAFGRWTFPRVELQRAVASHFSHCLDVEASHEALLHSSVVGRIGGLCDGVLGVSQSLVQAADDPAPAERVFRESREVFPNPERGFYAPRAHDRMDRLDDLRKQGISLLLVEMNLRDFKDRDLTPAKLDELRKAFAAARSRGLKIIFRAAYGFTGRDYRADPKDMNRIVGHIRQLGTVLTEDRDVLSGVQAGFLGPWGEWHGSNWGDPPSLDARRRVLFALLDAVPSPISVQVRRPMFIRDIFAGEPGGSELSEATAFSGSRLSRTGWHDDAFLARLPRRHGYLCRTRLEPPARARVVQPPRSLHALWR